MDKFNVVIVIQSGSGTWTTEGYYSSLEKAALGALNLGYQGDDVKELLASIEPAKQRAIAAVNECFASGAHVVETKTLTDQQKAKMQAGRRAAVSA